MAIYHFTTRGGKAHQSRAIRHSGYIAREGIYAERNDLIAREVGNMPTWAQANSADFWQACDELERANGRAYREFEVALPREFTHEQQRELVRQFVSEQLGNKHVYEWALHDKGDGNPHAHIMFSERMQDGIEREREQFFKRANSKSPERGGCTKDDGWRGTKGNPPVRLQEARSRWADLQNAHLERAGELARVDHRTLTAQGIDRIPQLHVGFRHQDRPEVRAERQQRNEAIKLAGQAPQARAALEVAQRELAEIAAAIREMDFRQQEAARAPAQEKAGATRVWFAFFDSQTWETRAGSQRILSREQNSPEVQARISLEMPPKCVLSADGRTWSGVFRDGIEAANYGRAQALEKRKAESERNNKEYIEKKNQEKLIQYQEDELLKKFRDEIYSYNSAISKENKVVEKINWMDSKVNTLVKESKELSENVRHIKWYERFNPFKIEHINKNAKRLDQDHAVCLEVRKNLETELDEIRKVKDIFWRREAPERKLAEAEKERQRQERAHKFEQEKAKLELEFKRRQQEKERGRGRGGQSR